MLPHALRRQRQRRGVAGSEHRRRGAGLRLAEVHVNVGDVVKRGQVLASLRADTMQAELAQLKAERGRGRGERRRSRRQRASAPARCDATGALSAQQINQYLTAEQTAQARLEAQRAAVKAQQLRLAQTQVVAPDDGVISARSATVGAVRAAGQELFRMIRRAASNGAPRSRRPSWCGCKPGTAATHRRGRRRRSSKGTVRMVAPTVDPQTRSGAGLRRPAERRRRSRPACSRSGDFDLGQSSALHGAAAGDGRARRLQLRVPPAGRPARRAGEACAPAAATASASRCSKACASGAARRRRAARDS